MSFTTIAAIGYKKGPWAGNMVQWLRALTALSEDLSLVPSSHNSDSQLSVAPALGEPVTLTSLWASVFKCTCTETFVHMHAYTYTLFNWQSPRSSNTKKSCKKKKGRGVTWASEIRSQT